MLDLALFHGYNNPWIRLADDPCFSRDLFYHCESIFELLDRLRTGNWCLGHTFVYKNLIFINQIDAGDEWLTIKDYLPIDSITFSAVFRRGDEYAKRYIMRLLKLSIKNKKEPCYDNPVIEVFI